MVYVPCGSVVRIRAKTGVEIALCSCPSSAAIPAYRIDPQNAFHGTFGQYNTLRTSNYLLNAQRPSERLFIAEITALSGNWASFPPHKHDQTTPDSREVAQEEILLFRVEPADGMGFCAVYGAAAGGDHAFLVRDNTVLQIPHGFHGWCSSPGTRLWYLQLFAGADKRHAVRLDPAYAWYSKVAVVLENIHANGVSY